MAKSKMEDTWAPYVAGAPGFPWTWVDEEFLPSRVGTKCRVKAWSKKNHSAWVEFESDGYETVAARSSVRGVGDD